MIMINPVEEGRFRLETRRLVLRPLRTQDADRITELVADYDVAKTLARVPHPYTRTDAQSWIGIVLAPDADEVVFAIEAGNLIGLVSFRYADDCPVIGYWIGKAFWGQGFMTEAAEAALLWQFNISEYPHIRAEVQTENGASLRILEKLGFDIVGKDMEYCLAQDRQLPHIVLRLGRQRFLERFR